MNLVGELVLARNQILQHANSQRGRRASWAPSQRLNLITTELQEGVMKTRMQPIGNVWNKFPRVVRDLALACGKQVRVEMEGERDRARQDDHRGDQRPAHPPGAQRRRPRHRAARGALRRGKPAEGYLRLRAFHEGGQVNIEISDDGAGIDVERITQPRPSSAG